MRFPPSTVRGGRASRQRAPLTSPNGVLQRDDRFDGVVDDDRGDPVAVRGDPSGRAFVHESGARKVRDQLVALVPDHAQGIGCGREHQQITSAGSTGNELDGQRLKRVCTQAGCPLTDVPTLDGYRAVDVGRAGFQPLRSLGAPEAVFIRYEGSTGDPLVLFLHPWSSETPTVDKVVYEGQSFWFAEHSGVGVVCWRSADGKILLSLTGSQSKDRMLTRLSQLGCDIHVSPYLSASKPEKSAPHHCSEAIRGGGCGGNRRFIR